MEYIPFLVAFGAGLLSFLSPCVVPLVPVYLASLAGPEILETGTKKNRLSTFLHSLSFVLGFSMIFVILGAIAGLTGFAISPNSALLNKIAGSLLIAFGLFMLVALKVPWLNYEKRFTLPLGTTTGYLRSFFIGAVFSLAWTACVGSSVSKANPKDAISSASESPGGLGTCRSEDSVSAASVESFDGSDVAVLPGGVTVGPSTWLNSL